MICSASNGELCPSQLKLITIRKYALTTGKWRNWTNMFPLSCSLNSHLMEDNAKHGHVWCAALCTVMKPAGGHKMSQLKRVKEAVIYLIEAYFNSFLETVGHQVPRQFNFVSQLEYKYSSCTHSENR